MERHRSVGQAEHLNAPSPFLLLFFDTRRRSALIAYRSLRHSLTHTHTHTAEPKKAHTHTHSSAPPVGGTQIPDEICFQTRTDGGVRRLAEVRTALWICETSFFSSCFGSWLRGEINKSDGLLSLLTFTAVNHFVCVDRTIPNSADVSITACWLWKSLPNMLRGENHYPELYFSQSKCFFLPFHIR